MAGGMLDRGSALHCMYSMAAYTVLCNGLWNYTIIQVLGINWNNKLLLSIIIMAAIIILAMVTFTTLIYYNLMQLQC